MFLENKSTVYGKLEGTAYTGETLADADFNARVREITYSFDVAEYRRLVADGKLDFHGSVKGKQTAKIGFKMDVAPGLTAATDPAWSKMLQACGLKKTTFAPSRQARRR